jgi:mono/diheme cytochrome c family protein
LTIKRLVLYYQHAAVMAGQGEIMKIQFRVLFGAALGAGMLAAGFGAFAGGDVPTKATNLSISTSRHNLTQSFLGANAAIMNTGRNDYGEVCVYCHTPHGANTKLAAPLWNRTFKGNTYKTYADLGTSTLTQPVGQPGINSLTCLSCHDGTTAIDSIINMPGSGRYQQSQETSVDANFLNTWSPSTTGHMTMGDGIGCQTCHQSAGVGDIFPAAADLSVVYIGTDLSNDHPVGIRFPMDAYAVDNVDFNVPNKVNSLVFFDSDGNGRMDAKNVRLYQPNGVFRVECASCHDPHGVPSNGPGTVFNPTFLRVANNTPGKGSALCLTCHAK